MNVPRGTILLLSLYIFCANVTPTQCRMSGGGSRGGGGGWRSSPSSGSGGRYKPSSPPRSYPTQTQPKPPTSTNTGHTYGWTTPNKPQTPTNTGHSSVPTQTQTGSQKAGWNTQPKPPTSTNTGHPYGWTTPNKPQTPTNTGHSSIPTQTQTGPQKAGWNVQPTNKQGKNAHSTPAPSYGWKNPQPKPADTTHRPNAPQNTPSYGWKNPPPKTPPSQTHNAPSTHSTDRQRQYPSQNHNSNSGKKYEKGYGKGYDQGYQRGLQQGKATVPKAYYPPPNHFGYPGGYNGGHSSYTYGGHSIHGTPHNYGYPVNSGYGYQTYGTGGGPGLGTGLAIGVVGGYLLHSALHPSPFSYTSSLGHSHYPSNSWGYSGGGYGSDYRYTRVDNSVTNNYYFNEPPPKAANSTSSEVDHWIHCIAFDPMTDTTLTNPNCTCTVAVERDTSTNTSTAVHSCTSGWGTHTEKTPISDIEVFEIEKANNQTANPEKLKAMEIEEKRREFYKKLETVVHMGCFMC